MSDGILPSGNSPYISVIQQGEVENGQEFER